MNRLHQNKAATSKERYDLVDAMIQPAGIHPNVEVIRYGDSITAIRTASLEKRSKISCEYKTLTPSNSIPSMVQTKSSIGKFTVENSRWSKIPSFTTKASYKPNRTRPTHPMVRVAMTSLEFQAYVVPPHVMPRIKDAKDPDMVRMPI